MNLPFECDSKGFFDPIDCEATMAMQLVTVGVPMPEVCGLEEEKDTKTYDAKEPFFTLESAEKPIENKRILEHDKAKMMSVQLLWLCKRQASKLQTG